MSSMTDIVFLLLIFFMLTSTLVTVSAIDVVLPKAGGKTENKSSVAVIDNVPLVAASLGMFTEPLDDPLWHFIAFSAGTGGSMLIIGSAAGVVAMGMEKIDFFWYLKKISWLALVGFLVGSVSFVFLRMIL